MTDAERNAARIRVARVMDKHRIGMPADMVGDRAVAFADALILACQVPQHYVPDGLSYKLPRHACELTITHNPHTADYATVEEYLKLCDERGNGYDDSELTPEDRALAVASNELWEIQWYPDTPVGSHVVAAATLERALARASE